MVVSGAINEAVLIMLTNNVVSGLRHPTGSDVITSPKIIILKIDLPNGKISQF